MLGWSLCPLWRAALALWTIWGAMGCGLEPHEGISLSDGPVGLIGSDSGAGEPTDGGNNADGSGRDTQSASIDAMRDAHGADGRADAFAADTRHPFPDAHGEFDAAADGPTVDPPDGGGPTADVAAPVTPQIRGIIDGVTWNGTEYVLGGWACDAGVERSIAVHVYLGGPAGRGTILRGASANLASEPAVRQACQTAASAHRFKIPLTLADIRQHGGKRIFVHGISDRGPNLLLARSGVFEVPTEVRLSMLAVTGQDLTIASGETVVIDKSVNLRLLTVNGTLRCPKDTGRYRLQLAGMLVRGLFECGTAAAPFLGQLDLAMSPGVPLMAMGERSVGVIQSGVLRLHGDKRNAGWTKLTRNASAGATEIVVGRNVAWRAGDVLAIGPTGFDPLEAEQVAVASVQGRTVRLRQPLRYPHHGQVQRFTVGAKTWTLDERAEVANLSRNIRIFPTGAPSTLDRLGAHTMIMRGAEAYVDAVEFIRMGRMGELARYPFHWHRAGDASGQYIRNSSIHHSFQRCVTVHGTHRAVVRDNVCFDHFGHGYFLEDGDEVQNVLESNLGMLSRRVPADRSLLVSETSGSALRFSAPATFWISNPDNTVKGNVASGSQGSGFWMAFQSALRCQPGRCVTVAANDPTANVFPRRTRTRAFDNNTAHSADVGFTWDGAPGGPLRNNPRNANDRELINARYSPPNVPTFRNLIAFKNIHTGVYFRGSTVQYDNNIYADNGWSLFFAYNQVVTNSLVVGHSNARSDRDFAYLHRRNKKVGQRGVVVYDGPFALSDVDFVAFPSAALSYGGVDMTPIPIGAIGGADRFTNAVQRLRFAPEPRRRVDFNADNNWLDSPWSMSLRDVDGSLSGRANVLIVPNHPFNHQAGRCQARAPWKAYVCDYRLGLMTFRGTGQNAIPFRVRRSDGAQTLASAGEAQAGTYHNKFNMILGAEFEYALDFAPNYQRPANLAVAFRTERVGEMSPVVRLQRIGRGCRLEGAKQVNSLAALRAQGESAYFTMGTDLYLRLQTTGGGLPRVSPARRAVSPVQPIVCAQ